VGSTSKTNVCKRFTIEHFLATWASIRTIYLTLMYQEGSGKKEKLELVGKLRNYLLQ